MSDLEVLYENLVNEKNLDYDESQHNALKVLNNLKTHILKSFSTKKIRTLFGILIFLPGKSQSDVGFLVQVLIILSKSFCV